MKDVLKKIRDQNVTSVQNQVSDQVSIQSWLQVYNLVWDEVSDQVLVRTIKHINDQVGIENYEKNPLQSFDLSLVASSRSSQQSSQQSSRESSL